MEKSRGRVPGERKKKWPCKTRGRYVSGRTSITYLILLTLVQRKREREYQRLRKEADDKEKLYLDWAQRFEIKSGGEWHPGEDGGS
jgi:hypothetical protein